MANHYQPTGVQFWTVNESAPQSTQGLPASHVITGVAPSGTSGKGAFITYDVSGYPDSAKILGFYLKGAVSKSGAQGALAASDASGTPTLLLSGSFIAYLANPLPNNEDVPFDLYVPINFNVGQLRGFGYIVDGVIASTVAVQASPNNVPLTAAVTMSVEEAYIDTDYVPVDPPIGICFWERNVLTTEDCSEEGGGGDPTVYQLVVIINGSVASIAQQDISPIPPGFVMEADFSLTYPGRADVQATWNAGQSIWICAAGAPEQGDWNLKQGTNTWLSQVTVINAGGGGDSYTVYVTNASNMIFREVQDIFPEPPGFVWGVELSIIAEGTTYPATWSEFDGAYTVLGGYNPQGIGTGASGTLVYGGQSVPVILNNY